MRRGTGAAGGEVMSRGTAEVRRPLGNGSLRRRLWMGRRTRVRRRFEMKGEEVQ